MAKITAETVEAVNRQTDLVSLIEQYTHLEKRGYDWWGCCPFHNEKTPSFHVIPDKKMYYCFGCGKGGSTITFMMEMEKLSFTEAVKELAKRAGIPVFYAQGEHDAEPEDTFKEDVLELYKRVSGTFHHFLLHTSQGSFALRYLEERAVSPAMLEQFNLGFAPADRLWLFKFLQKKGYSPEFLAQSGLFSKKHPEVSFFSDRIMFPICNRHGQPVAFGGRILKGDGPKYLNTGDLPQYKKGETLFAFPQALAQIRKEKTVVFCEGYMDVIAFHQAGITNAVAPLGTALTEEQIKLIHSFADTAILSFDSDAAGQAATYKAIKLCRAGHLQVRVLVLKDGKDPAEILMHNGAEGLTTLLKNAMIDSNYLIQIALNQFDVMTPEGKVRAAAFLFPYIEVLESDIQKESTIHMFSADLGISAKALLADYMQYAQKQKRVLPSRKSKTMMGGMLKMTAELRIMLAVAANPHLFKKMRVSLSADDFEDSAAKDLFIVLEECYRADANTYDSLLVHCSSEPLKKAVSSAIIKGEFADNPEKLVYDGIGYIKQNALQRQKELIIRKLQALHQSGAVDDVRRTNELLSEKLHIDALLASLKETT